MYRKEVNEHSPMRILEQSIHGGLGKGNFGVVMARAGIGKTAFVVQLALDDLMRERDVLHVAMHQTVEHVHAWYDALFDDLALRTALQDKEEVRAVVGHHRVIQTYSDTEFGPERLEKALALYKQTMQFKPSVLVIDGFDWEGETADRRKSLRAFKELAKRENLELWMTAQTHRHSTPPHPTKVTPPVEAFVDLVDVAVFLEPKGSHATVRLLKDHDDAPLPEVHLELDANTMCVLTEDGQPSQVRLPAYTLLSGGAAGAEAEFGRKAALHGVDGITFSFEGRTVAYDHGLINLTDAELKLGEVSASYIKAQLHREFPNTPTMKKILQSIFHQVCTAGEVFVVGSILPDKTVQGGTGWAAELARHWHKPLYVFDQDKERWFQWKGQDWAEIAPPRITKARFTGTGTRRLNAAGKAAIADLFHRSFKA